MKQKEVEDQYMYYYNQTAVEAVERKDFTGALKLTEKALERYPGNLSLINALGYVYTHMEEYRKARQVFKSILESQENVPEALKSIARNNIAFTNVMLDDPSLLQEADEYSLQAYRT